MMKLFVIIDHLPESAIVVGVHKSYEDAVQNCDNIIKGQIKEGEKWFPQLIGKIECISTECLREISLTFNGPIIGYTRKIYSMTGDRVYAIQEIEAEI